MRCRSRVIRRPDSVGPLLSFSWCSRQDAAGAVQLSGDGGDVHLFGSTQYTSSTSNKHRNVTGQSKPRLSELRSTVCAGTVREGNDPPKGTIQLTLKGSEIQAEGSDADGPFDFVARRPVVSTGAPRSHQFTPTKFYNYFSSKYEPVLHVLPGDTIETWSVDAGGMDASGKRRSPGGNPLTGPFFVDGAWPGDTLVVKLNRVRLTRDTAMSGDQIVPTALGPGYYQKGVDWDRSHAPTRPAIDNRGRP